MRPTEGIAKDERLRPLRRQGKLTELLRQPEARVHPMQGLTVWLAAQVQGQGHLRLDGSATAISTHAVRSCTSRVARVAQVQGVARGARARMRPACGHHWRVQAGLPDVRPQGGRGHTSRR